MTTRGFSVAQGARRRHSGTSAKVTGRNAATCSATSSTTRGTCRT
ncbi:hypothetical protein [Paractinoplanes rishiriensis]|nr:hypothetical protein [Actinoplanes rishiriensis]